ncbi:helix-turn-helix domain-containing protein [Bradyrhizobium sp. ORS 86]|uniref:helix-turn-helix domain-containing protein n=1 Tax=Bradyrhizobium sp. ORS 86 TaxID=1685970 RepID=UPI00388D734F
MQRDGDRLARAAKLLEQVPLPRAPRDISDRTPAPPRLVSTRPYPPAEQFEVWKARMAPWLDVALPEGRSPAQGFEVEYIACNLGNLVLSSGHFAAQTFTRTRAASRRAPVDAWALFRVRSGEVWLETGGQTIHAEPGAIFLVPLNNDLRGRITDYDGLLLTLPRSAFASVAEQFDRACNRILSGNLIELLADYLDTLVVRLVEMSPDELRQAGRATAEMIAACLQPAADRPGEARGSVESVLFERARLYIESHLGDFDLTPDRIAQQLRISRSNLYRAFESVGGVAGYILRKRLHAAHAELVGNPERRIQEIAHRHGFKLASDFTRAFRREFGMSPREARERARR